jgi:hypothetical protein
VETRWTEAEREKGGGFEDSGGRLGCFGDGTGGNARNGERRSGGGVRSGPTCSGSPSALSAPRPVKVACSLRNILDVANGKLAGGGRNPEAERAPSLWWAGDDDYHQVAVLSKTPKFSPLLFQLPFICCVREKRIRTEYPARAIHCGGLNFETAAVRCCRLRGYVCICM